MNGMNGSCCRTLTMENRSNEVVETLDKAIAETSDLYLLNAFLDMKLSTCKTALDSRIINFTPSFVLANETADFDVILGILKKSPELCTDYSGLFKNIIEYITSKHKDVNCQSNIIKLLSYLASFCVKNDIVDILLDNAKPEFLYIFLIDALNNTETKTKAYETLSSYFKLFPKIEQIRCLNEVFKFCFQNNNLDTFCALLNHIPKESIYDKSCCFNNDKFWFYVASCISGLESYLQKQGEFILSKYIYNVKHTDAINDNCVANDFETSWQAFIMLIDIGREKQLHLVAPSLNMLKYICNLPFMWQKCVYKIYLEHSQTTIVYQVTIEILRRRYIEENLGQIFKMLFSAINTNEHKELSCKMFKSLHSHCAGFNEGELNIVIKEFVQISWTAVSFWKVIKNVFTSENKSNLNGDLLQEVIRCAVHLPHVYVRTQCIKFLINTFWDETDYNKMYKFILYSLKWSDAINFQHLQCRRYSKDIIDPVIKDLLETNHDINDLKIIETRFLILKCTNVNIWPFFQDYLNELNPHIALFVWKYYLCHFDTKTLFITIEALLLNYFNEHLLEETTDLFIELFKLFASKCLVMPDKLINQVINKPLFSSEEFNDNQIYAALVLIQDFLFKSDPDDLFSDIKINITESNGFIVLEFWRCNAIVNSIEVKDSRICIECITLIFELNKGALSVDTAKNIIGVFTKIFESQDNKVLLNIYGKLCNFLVSSNCTDLVIDFIHVCHNNLLHLKRDRYFKTIVKEFIQVVYSEIYIQHNRNKINSINIDLLELSESYPLIRLDLIKSMWKLCATRSIHHEIFVSPVLEIYHQGTVITKHERTEFNLCQEFLQNIDCKQDDHSLVELGDYSNPNFLNAASRCIALQTLLCISYQNIELVTNNLRERYMRHLKKRYFPDSKIHYEKLRILQALLALICGVEISKEEGRKISTFVFQCFEEETNQNCVKQLLNWILILVLKEVSRVLGWIDSRLPNITPSVLISVIPSMYHLALFGDEKELDKTVRLVLPWTMGAQFRLRIYAQDLIRRILEHARRKNYVNFLNRYQHLEDCLITCIESTGDMLANTMKSDILFLNDFLPIRDKSLSTIFYDIPRLNKVNPTEWQNMPALLDDNEILQKINVSLRPTSSIFADTIDQFLIGVNESNKEQEGEYDVNKMLHIQKKITPWKSALENADVQVEPGFILIASLIDKAQNLGGLSRTCEVFGIRNMVFNDAKVTNDKEFKSLSMSSEVWINATEVKIKHLAEYIVTLQSEGYCVIGAEQTAGSKKLNEFRFPRKMALILGNEKTGIPPEIIPLLNECLEIPQFGQTRSLNVHVAGATFIWEYAKQHLV